MNLLLAAVPLWLTSWLTPLWLLGVGAVVALVVLGLAWALLRLVRRTAAEDVPLVIGEGVLLPITWIVIGAACFGVLGSLLVPEPAKILKSLPRLPYAQKWVVNAVIPAASAQDAADVAQPVPVHFRGDELQSLTVESDQLLLLADAPTEGEMRGKPREVSPAEPFSYSRPREGNPAFGGEYIDNFYVTNLSDREANLKIALATAPEFPQVAAIPLMTAAIVGLYLLYFLQAWACPRVSAIALATSKSEIAQPLFGIIVALGIFLIVLFVFLPYNTFGEDIKVLKDSGLTLIMVLAIMLGVWSAGNSVSDEIEGAPHSRSCPNRSDDGSSFWANGWESYGQSCCCL